MVSRQGCKNMSTKKHHDIIKVIFNGNKHLKHVLSSEEVRQLTLVENRFPLTKLPVCGHCEKLGLWSKDSITKRPIGVCKSCGSITQQPITYSTYLASKMDVDPTGDTFKRMLVTERKIDNYKRAVYLHKFRIG
jgi:hypothetical protein